LENRLWSGGTGNSEIIYMDLYPNQWDLVNEIRISSGCDTLICTFENNVIFVDTKWISEPYRIYN
jgi:hypothetical protein